MFGQLFVHEHVQTYFFLQMFEHIKYIQIEKYNKASDLEKLDIEVNATKIFHQAIENCKPLLGTQICLKAGTRYTVGAVVLCESVVYMYM